ncbi:MAG: TatD family hydrolase [Candidatus Paceibacterota bacterium]|jgi:TatD DNase family protein
MIFDTHAHLNFFEFDKDRDEVIKKCLEAQIGIINIGTNFKSSEVGIGISKEYSNVFSAVGLHPTNITSDFLKTKEGFKTSEGFLEDDFDYKQYKELAKSKKVVAIGECGLDYWYRPKGAAKRELFKEKQKKVFIKQLDLAEELNLPVIIHCRSAFDDLLEILSKRKVKGVLHCFTGSKEEAERLSSLGLYFGINGIIFKMELEEAIKVMPMDKILLETDCPYLSPPMLGERNNPLSLKYVIEEISRIKGVSIKEIEEVTYKNSKDLFNI